MREFDFHNEQLREESGKKGDKKAIVLARYKPTKQDQPSEDKIKETSSDCTTEKDLQAEENRILFERDIAFFNVLDPTRMFETKI